MTQTYGCPQQHPCNSDCGKTRAGLLLHVACSPISGLPETPGPQQRAARTGTSWQQPVYAAAASQAAWQP